MDEGKIIGMEHIRTTLLKDIELQEEVRKQFFLIMGQNKKILKRMTVIYISIAGILFFMGCFAIYLLSRPISQNEIAMQHIIDFNKMAENQRKLNEIDRKDIAAARKEVFGYLNKQDSIKRLQDSTIDAKYRKAIKK